MTRIVQPHELWTIHTNTSTNTRGVCWSRHSFWPELQVNKVGMGGDVSKLPKKNELNLPVGNVWNVKPFFWFQRNSMNMEWHSFFESKSCSAAKCVAVKKWQCHRSSGSWSMWKTVTSTRRGNCYGQFRRKGEHIPINREFITGDDYWKKNSTKNGWTDELTRDIIPIGAGDSNEPSTVWSLDVIPLLRPCCFCFKRRRSQAFETKQGKGKMSATEKKEPRKIRWV